MARLDFKGRESIPVHCVGGRLSGRTGRALSLKNDPDTILVKLDNSSHFEGQSWCPHPMRDWREIVPSP